MTAGNEPCPAPVQRVPLVQSYADKPDPSRTTAAHGLFVRRASERHQSSISFCRHSLRDSQAPRT